MAKGSEWQIGTFYESIINKIYNIFGFLSNNDETELLE